MKNVAKANIWKVGWWHLTKKLGERFQPPFLTPTTIAPGKVPMGFAPDLITLAHPEHEIKLED